MRSSLLLRLGRPARVLALACVGGLFLLPFPGECADAKYVEPDIALLDINPNSLLMPPSSRRRIAADVAGYVCRGGGMTPEYLQQSTKLLALAMVLDPTNRLVVLANNRLRSGKAPAALPSVKTAAELAEILRVEAAERGKVLGRSDAFLAGYFLMMAAELAPDSDNVAYDYEMFKRKNLNLSWDALLGRTAAGATNAPATSAGSNEVRRITRGLHPAFADQPKPFARRQSSVRGLFVTTMAGGVRSGQALQIIATILGYADPSKTHCAITTPVGEEMSTSWKEALRVVQVRYPQWQGGAAVSVSFSDKYSPKDGGSAGMAFAMLLLSLLDGIDLDEKCAVTGDITVDWKIREIGSLATKLRGAVLDKCAYVIIPKDNERQLEDAILLNSVKQLWELQVFTADDLGEAISIARVDREGNLTRAMTLFEKVQKHLNANGAAGLRNPEAVKLLQEIVALAPNHASASYLLKAVGGGMPKRLTLGGSLEETLLLVAPCARYLSSERLINSTEDVPISEAVLKSLTARLGQLQPVLAEGAVPLHAAAGEYIRAVESATLAKASQSKASSAGGGRNTRLLTDTGRRGSNPLQGLEASLDQLRTAGQKLVKELQALQMDGRRMEILRRE